MHLDPIMPTLVAAIFLILAVGLISQRLRIPFVATYLAAGVVVGPFGLSLISNQFTINALGAVGVVLLLFFVGMEVSFTRLIASWKIALIGTFLQIAISVAVVAIVGLILDWNTSRVVLIGFVISLSSTAVVIKMLQDWREADTKVGRNVIGVLLAQDIALIPMLVIIGLLRGGPLNLQELALQTSGGIAFAILLIFLARIKELRLPFQALREDSELQVFAALILCFGMATLSGLLHLSTALGAFVGGLLVTTARETHWVHESLSSFRVVFVAGFFISIGMLVDFNLLLTNITTVIVLVLAVLVTNSFINTFILRVLGLSWRDSVQAGAMLSQIGEFSFILIALGLEAGIINDLAYQTSLAVIFLSLLLSPAWIVGIRQLDKRFAHGG